ncbi:MAG: choice-of-anchor V domain-containing protein [Saprospiraceae bacterium]
MNKMYKTKYFKIASLLFCVLIWLANSGNPPNGRTGAPFNGHCGDCHSGGSYQGIVSISGLPATIDANTTYPMSITLSPTMGNPVRGGFQLVAVDGSNTNAGDLINLSGATGTEMFGGREYIEHRNPQNFGGGDATWDFNWTSPSSASGNSITFYFIGNFTNGSGSGGDSPFNSSQTFTFAGSPPISAFISGSSNVSCFGGNDGTATADATGGAPPYSFLWSNGQTGQTAVNLGAGTYTVTVSDGSGSSGTAQTTITQPPNINLSTFVSGFIDCNNPTVSATASATGGVGGFSYSWSDGQFGSEAFFSTGGTYFVTATDGNGCTKSTSVTINSNTVPPIANVNPPGMISCFNPTVQLNGAGSSTGPSFTYMWSTLDGLIISGQNTLAPVVGAPGTYILTVTNTANGCTAEAFGVVEGDNSPPEVSTTGGSLDCVNSSTQISASISGNASYSWVGPNGFQSNLQSPTVTQVGTYAVTVTDLSNGCTNTGVALVVEDIAPPVVTTQGATLDCANSSVTIQAASNPSADYAWTGPNGFQSNEQNPTVSEVGTYTVVATSQSNGCTAEATATVDEDLEAPTVSATGGLLTCSQTSTTLNVTSMPASNYQWTGPGNFSSTSQMPSVSEPGEYTVVATRTDNGCTAETTAIVTEDVTAPVFTVTNGVLNCTSLFDTLSANSTDTSLTYVWTGPNGFSFTGPNPEVVLGGMYTVVATSSVNGCTLSKNANVVVDFIPPIAAADTPEEITCAFPVIQLDGTGSSMGSDFSYAWTTSDGTIDDGANTLTPTISAAGTYQLEVTDESNGCTSTTDVLVEQDPPLQTNMLGTTAVSCNGGSDGTASVEGLGGSGTYTYLWSNGSTMSTASNLAAGTYSVVVSDNQGCSATATNVVVTEPLAVQANATAMAETSLGANDGTATAAPSGGTMPYTYLWSNDSTSQTISGLAPGSYTVTVTDMNNCTGVQTVNVNSFNCNISTTTSFTAVRCNGGADGTATVEVLGASDPISYSWSNGDTTATATGLAAGVYTVNILDGNGCPTQTSVTVTQPMLLTVSTVATGETSLGANDGTATATPTGGTGPFTYSWTNGGVTQTITNLNPGTYTVTITDLNFCSATSQVTVPAFSCQLSSNITQANVGCFGLSNGQATVSITGGALPLVYSWSNGSTGATATGLAAGTYTVTVVDANNCDLIAETTITQPDALNLVSSASNVECPESTDGAIELTITGGTTPYTVTPGLTGLGVGTYDILVEDANGCQIEGTETIISEDVTAPQISCPPAGEVCAGTSVAYDLPVATDNCDLDGATPTLVSGLPSGSVFPEGSTTVEYMITDASNNTAVCAFTVLVLPNPEASLAAVVNDVDNQGMGSISIVVENGSEPYSFIWTLDMDVVSTEQNPAGLFMGDYLVEVSDANGCSTTLGPITVDNTVAANEQVFTPSIRLIPNPVQEQFRLEIDGVQPQYVRILNTQGQLIRNLNPSEWTGLVEVSEVPSGLYFLQILSDTGRVFSIKWYKSE